MDTGRETGTGTLNALGWALSALLADCAHPRPTRRNRHMLQAEFTDLTGYEPTAEQWEVITEVYGFHPLIPDVGGKKVFADLWARGGYGLICDMHDKIGRAHV